jgi:hypothetical protein
VLHSRALLIIGVVVALAVPVFTLPRLPHVSLWPALLGLVPWVAGKYLLCPLRWRVLTTERQSRWWHVRAYAESELLGLFTPGHVGADAWRFRRLTAVGLARSSALTSIGLDRLVGAIGLAAFVAFAGTALPSATLLVACCAGVITLAAAVVVARVRPDWIPRPVWPRPKQLAYGLLLSAGYQLTIAGLLLGTVAATGYSLSPMSLLGAFGASQLAGAVPGPNGASARDGALVVALVALGVPWVAAAVAVSLKAALAWLPALALGGSSLLVFRRARRQMATALAA